VNEPIRLSLDPGRFHYFDPATAEALSASAGAPVAG
jgi:hypothetical protein